MANNLFFGNTQNGAASADTIGTGSLALDPLFVSAPTNLRINNASPAKAAGVAGGSVPTTDFDGATRPNPPAIGAFEPIAPPVMGTASSSNVSASTVDLSGTVSSDGGAAVSERGFVYSLTAANANPLINGTSVVKVTVSGTTGLFSSGVTGLTSGAGYSFKAFATKVAGTNYSNLAAFTTLLPPTATTGVAGTISQTGATLAGSVNPNGNSTTALFEYGLTTSYGSSASALPPAQSGVSPVSVSAVVNGLTCGTTYHFRVKVTGSSGTISGSDATFTTSPCGPAINFFTANPTLVNPLAASTLSWSATPGTSLTLNGSAVSAPTGSTVVNPSVTTTYTLVATNGSGSTTRTATVSINSGTSGLTAPTVTAPAALQTLVVAGVGFTWTGVPGATGYDVRLLDSSTGAVVFSGSLLGAGSTSTLISLPAGSYGFAVRACSGGFADFQCGGYGTVSFTVSPAGPAGAPTVTFPTQGANLNTSTQILSWTAVTPNPALSGLTYEVLLRDLAAGTTALQITVPSPNLSTIFTMKSSTLYELKVRACQAGCGPYSTAVTFAVTLPPIPTLAPTGPSCSVSGGNSLTCNWNSVANADAYQVQVVQAPPAGPGGGALTVAAKQVSATTVTLPVPAGAATVFIAACNGDGCGLNTTVPITAAGPNPSQANIGTPMAGTVVAGPGVLFTWNRVPGDAGSGLYRLFVQDLSRQSTALDVYTTNNSYSAFFKAEGARYDALVVSNPGLPGAVTGPSQGFNVAGASATSPTLVSPPHNSTLPSGNIQLGWSPVPGATLYQYFVAILGQGNASAGGVTPGLLAQVPLTGVGPGTVYSGIVRACPAGATCVAGSDAGWGPWSNAPGGPGVTNFTVIP